jgi:hypothetical protein
VTARAVLLALASAAGVLLARALDGLGLLPGVVESDAIRTAATDPRWTGLGMVLCVLLGVAGARLLSRSPRAAVAVLVLGQQAVVVALEEVARELAGAPEPPGGETGLWVAALLQVPLAALAVAAALVVLRLVPPGAQPTLRPPRPGRQLPPYRLVLLHRVDARARGRAPPEAA